MSSGRRRNANSARALFRALFCLGLWCGLALARAASAAPVWLDANGQPNPLAQEALVLLADAASDGLAAQDYKAADLHTRASTLGGAVPLSASAQAFDRDLDAAMQRYLRDLHFGRVDPRSMGFRVPRWGDRSLDIEALLHAAVAEHRLLQAVAEVRPHGGQYTRLREALARYRTLAAGPAPKPLPDTRSVKPGEPYTAAQALHERLSAFGDLGADAAPAGDRFDAALSEGVARFQQRHGLTPDGVLGHATVAALNVPLAQRVQQLELALERLRWLPDPGSRPFIAINIPMFRLWARDPAAPASAPLAMGVVVGRALNTQTPVLSEEMHHLIFRPYWNVPRSIVRKESLPAIARDAHYLERNDMEIVRGAGDDAQPVDASAANLTLLGQGALRLRQRPGPKNSLGLVKFVFPNDADVYLHGTPAVQLFGRARRDFSHGCVRLEDPVALAEWLLREQPPWTRGRIEAAMAGAAPLRVELKRPVPVVLYYLTAMVWPGDPAVHFADDIYGHDARLAHALAARRAP